MPLPTECTVPKAAIIGALRKISAQEEMARASRNFQRYTLRCRTGRLNSHCVSRFLKSVEYPMMRLEKTNITKKKPKIRNRMRCESSEPTSGKW